MNWRPAPDPWRPRRHAPDYALLAVVAMLLVLGLIAVYSASYTLGASQYGDSAYFAKRHAASALIGVLGLLAVMTLDYRALMRLSPLLMLAAMLALGAVLLPGLGVEQNGARRWLATGSLPALQPSEFAKFAVLVYMAAWLATRGDTVRELLLGTLPFTFMAGIVAALILVEPDLGTAALVVVITGTLFFVAGARVWHVLALLSSAAATAALLVFVAGYGWQRVLSFTSAEADPGGFGYQTLQMLAALASGGVTGLGLGASRQKLASVYGAHTDGVLAIIGEELGFAGVCVVLLLFAVLLWRGFQIARRAADPFGSLLATGVLAWIGGQMLLNVGGVTRSIPFTGIPLPFLSYGGSSLVMTLVAAGLLLSISRYAALEKPLTEPRRGAVRATSGGAGQ